MRPAPAAVASPTIGLLDKAARDLAASAVWTQGISLRHSAADHAFPSAVPEDKLWGHTEFQVPPRPQPGRMTAPAGSEAGGGASQHSFSDVSDHIPAGLAVFDPQLRVVSVNRVLAELLGRPADSFINLHVAGVFPHDLATSLAARLRHVTKTGSAAHDLEVESSPLHPAPDEGEAAGPVHRHKRHWLVRFFPVPGGMAGMLLNEITDRKHAEQHLRHRCAVAESASAAKDRFLAVLSHELRTPLTPVLSLATSLEHDPALPAELRQTLEVIRRNVEVEARLIDDLLDLTRIAKGKLTLHPVPVDAHLAVRTALDTCRSEINGKQIEVALELAAARPHLHADPARLQQVLWNLIKNAVKFTPSRGRLTVRTFHAPPVDGAERLVIEVTDTGMGIPPDLLPRLFRAFEQGGDQVTRQFGGLGLGLAISRTMIKAHGGTLSAHSDGPDRGSTFRIELPTACVPEGWRGGGEGPPNSADAGETAPAAVRTPAAATALVPACGRRSARVLLVDDHADTLCAMARLLERQGHVVHTAETFSAAVNALASEQLDLLISDIGLPDGSGHDLVRFARSAYPERPLKAIALSGYGMDDDLKQSHDAGFDAHLTKPVNFQQLEAVIAQLVPPK
jgi:signal transduction histidine kinase